MKTVSHHNFRQSLICAICLLAFNINTGVKASPPSDEDPAPELIEQIDYGAGSAAESIQVEELNPASNQAFAVAASSKCKVGEWSKVPFTYSSWGPSNEVRRNKVLAVDKPWGLGSKAYLWDDNKHPKQQWWLECVGFQEHDQLNKYRLHYAYNASLCLTAKSLKPGTKLTVETCDEPWLKPKWGVKQVWEMEYMGNKRKWPDAKGRRVNVETYRFFNEVNNTCIDVYNGDNKNGTPVELWYCNGLNNQLWY